MSLSNKGENTPSSGNKKKHFQRYKSEYEVFQGIGRSKLGEYHAFCRHCHADISIKYGGRDDCRKHVASKKHLQNAKIQASKPLSAYFQEENTEVLNIVQAEASFTQFLVDSNLPIATADKAGPLFKRMFPDSKVAQKYACGRTKTTAIIKTLAAETSKTISDDLSHMSFSLATDGSNDDGKSQLYPVVVRYFDDKAGMVVSLLLSVPKCEGSCTGENIFKVLNTELSQRNIAWENCISFSCDNASVMTGIHKGVAAFIKKEHESVYIQGCACHLIHLAARHAGKELPVSIEDFLIDIYFYLDKSSKRQKELHQFQNLFGVKPHKILKHVSTRWLSLGSCISRLLEQWSALVAFFEAQPLQVAKTSLSSHRKRKIEPKTQKDKNPPKTVTVTGGHVSKQKQHEPETKKIKLGKEKEKKKTVEEKRSEKERHEVLSKKSKSETRSNQMKLVKEGQRNEKSESQKDSGKAEKSKHCEKEKESNKSPEACAMITRLERIRIGFQSPLTKLYCLFLKSTLPLFDQVNIFLQNEAPCIHKLKRKLTSVLSEIFIRFVKPESISKSQTLLDVDFSERKHQRRREEVVIGAETRKYLNEMIEAGELSSSDQDTFFKSVRNFYCVASKYVVQKFPLRDELLTHAEVADINLRGSTNYASVKYFLERFPKVFSSDEAHSDTSTISRCDEVELQFHRYQVDPLTEEILQEERIDVAWHKIGQLKNEEGCIKYSHLCKVMKVVLTLPHSNADCERIFSSVRKNKTEFRPNLSVDVLSALMVQKCYSLAYPNAVKQPLPQETLRKVKSATYRELNK